MMITCILMKSNADSNEVECRLHLHQATDRITVMPAAVQNKDFGDVGVEGQAEQALKNMGEILKEAGLDYDDVVKTVILLADIGDFAAVNAVYGALSAFPASHGHCRLHHSALECVHPAYGSLPGVLKTMRMLSSVTAWWW